MHQILTNTVATLTELSYVKDAVTSDESVSNADLKELIIGNYSSDKLCTQPTIVEARGYNNHLTVTWTKPTTTNVAVAKYNVYICPNDTAPLDLTDFTKIGSVAYNEFENNFTYVSPELLPNVNYWVMVTSESKRGVNNDQLVLNGSNIMKCIDKSAIASNIFTITEENNTVTSCYTTQTFDYILNIPEEINGKTVVGVGSPDGNNATVAAGNFRDIVLPDTLTKVNSYFLNSKSTCLNLGISKDNCNSFDRYEKLPDAVTDVGDYAFNAETGLKDSNLILPTSLVNIGAYAYSNTKLTTVKFTEGTLQKIGNSAFENCTQINTVYVPNVVELGEIAFKGCTGLVNLECNATTLTTQFQNCPALLNIVLDEMVTNVGSSTFSVTNTGYYTSPNNVTKSGDYYTSWKYGSTNVSGQGYFGGAYEFTVFCNLRRGSSNSFQNLTLQEFRTLYVKNPNTVFTYDLVQSNITRTICNYGERPSPQNINLTTCSFCSPLLPLLNYAVINPWGTSYYTGVCYDFQYVGSWWSGGDCDGTISSDTLYYNAAGGIRRLKLVCKPSDINFDNNSFTTDKYIACLKANTSVNLGWLADQFIEQHDINEVVVPSFK